jgi:hypothetical protein
LSKTAYSDQAPVLGAKVPNSLGTLSSFSLSAAVENDGIKNRDTSIIDDRYLPIVHLRVIRFTIDLIALPE